MLRLSTASLTRNPKKLPRRADGRTVQPSSAALGSGTSLRTTRMTMTWRWSARGLSARAQAESSCLEMAPRSSPTRMRRSCSIRPKTTRCSRPIPPASLARIHLVPRASRRALPLKYPSPQPQPTTKTRRHPRSLILHSFSSVEMLSPLSMSSIPYCLP